MLGDAVPRAPLLAALAVLLAGCTGEHADHGDAEGPALLFGALNEAGRDITVSWTVFNATNDETLNGTRSVPAGESFETLRALGHEGAHTLVVNVTWGGNAREETFTFATADCPTTHLVVRVAADGDVAEHVRECHE